MAERKGGYPASFKALEAGATSVLSRKDVLEALTVLEDPCRDPQ